MRCGRVADAESQARVRARLETLRAPLGPLASGGIPAGFRLAKVEGAAPRRDETSSALAAAELLRVWIEDLDRVESAVTTHS